MRAWLIAFALLFSAHAGLAATDHFGRVTFGGLPVPGATVTASQGDQRLATVTDQEGVFHLAAPSEGLWTVRVEMIGFAVATQEIAITDGAPASMFELKMLPLAEMTAGLPQTPTVPSAGRVTSDPASAGGSERTRPAKGATGTSRTSATAMRPRLSMNFMTGFIFCPERRRMVSRFTRRPGAKVATPARITPVIA